MCYYKFMSLEKHKFTYDILKFFIVDIFVPDSYFLKNCIFSLIFHQYLCLLYLLDFLTLWKNFLFFM